MNQQAMSSVEPSASRPVLGSNTSTPVDLDVTLPSFCVIFTSGSPKTMNRLPAPVFFSSSSPIARSGFIRTAGSTGQLCRSFAVSRRRAVEREAADEQQVEPDPLDRLLRGFLDVAGRPCRTPGRRDRHAPPLPSASVLALGVESSPGNGSSRVEGEPLALVGVLHAGLAEVVEDHRDEVLRLAASCSGHRPRPVPRRRPAARGAATGSRP